MTSHTYREIKDQYNRLRKTKSYLDSKAADIKEIYDRHSFVVYIGCGSSYSLTKSLAVGTMTHLGKKAIAIPAGDILLRPETYRQLLTGSLVVALSRSGATSELLLAYDALKKAGASFSLLSFSCRTKQKLAAISEYALELPWAFDQSVCQTSSVTNLYFAGMYLLAHLADNQDLKGSLLRIMETGDGFISRNEAAWAEIAAMDWDCGVTLGDAQIGGICEEGALAFKEICQLPSNYYPLLDSRHGPVVIFDHKTLVIAAVSDVDSKYEKALIRDIRKRGCVVVTVSGEPLAIEGTINFCVGETCEYPALGIPFINVAQMITNYKAIKRNIDPDNPNGLDPWITFDE